MSTLHNLTVLSPKDSLVSFEKCTNRKLTLNPNASTQILAVNKDRIYALIINLSLVNVTLNLGEANAIFNQGIVLMSKGSSFEIGKSNLFSGRLSGISAEPAELSVIECSL